MHCPSITLFCDSVFFVNKHCWRCHIRCTRNLHIVLCCIGHHSVTSSLRHPYQPHTSTARPCITSIRQHRPLNFSAMSTDFTTDLFLDSSTDETLDSLLRIVVFTLSSMKIWHNTVFLLIAISNSDQIASLCYFKHKPLFHEWIHLTLKSWNVDRVNNLILWK